MILYDIGSGWGTVGSDWILQAGEATGQPDSGENHVHRHVLDHDASVLP